MEGIYEHVQIILICVAVYGEIYSLEEENDLIQCFVLTVSCDVIMTTKFIKYWTFGSSCLYDYRLCLCVIVDDLHI